VILLICDAIYLNVTSPNCTFLTEHSITMQKDDLVVIVGEQGVDGFLISSGKVGWEGSVSFEDVAVGYSLMVLEPTTTDEKWKTSHGLDMLIPVFTLGEQTCKANQADESCRSAILSCI
jgi:hypothetical protein